MLEDPDIQHLMKWTPAGDSFTVSNPTEFAKVILPNYFKHNNVNDHFFNFSTIKRIPLLRL